MPSGGYVVSFKRNDDINEDVTFIEAKISDTTFHFQKSKSHQLNMFNLVFLMTHHNKSQELFLKIK